LRIKRLVFNIFKQSLKEPVLYQDWQFIQYMLPCFVALIGEATKKKEFKQKNLKVYIQIVHNLIQSFELHLRKKPLKTPRPEKPSLDWLIPNQATCLSRQFTIVQKELSVTVYKCCKSFEKEGSLDWILSTLCFSQFEDSLSGNDKMIKIGRNVFQPWLEDVQNIISRMMLAVRKVDLARPMLLSNKNLLQAFNDQISLGKGRAGEGGEWSVFPITFCRACKKFEDNLKKCQFCADIPGFGDTHWFCSLACEQKGLDTGHGKEHEQQVLVNLGLLSI